MKSSKLFLFAILAFVLVLSGCPGKGANDKDSETEINEVAKLAQSYKGPQANWGDTIELQFTVSLPKYMYINWEAPKPVKLMTPPGDTFKFAEKEYFLQRPAFPLTVRFEVPPGAEAGVTKLPFALRLLYCNKADDICLIKNDLVQVEFMVLPERGTSQQTVVVESKYSVEAQPVEVDK